MAEISVPSGPSTAPRRRCCPAWPWTATAWARPPPDACPPRACQVPRRPGNTWLVSTYTRTRVSVAHCAGTHPPALMGLLGREPRSNPSGWSWLSLSCFTKTCRRLSAPSAEVGLQEDRPVSGVPGSRNPPEAQVSAITTTLGDPSPSALEEVEFAKN